MKLQELMADKWQAVSVLMEDPDSRPLVAKHIGQAIACSDCIIHDMPFEQVTCLVSRANFADSEYECVCVAKMFYDLIYKMDVLPLVTVHRGAALGSRCLISLSLFIKAMEVRCRRRGAPPPVFYREVGIESFRRCDMRAVAEHFTNWEGFLGESFVA